MRVGVTGISSDLGLGLLERLDADARVTSIVAFDIAPPLQHSKKCSFVSVDLAQPGTEVDFNRSLQEHKLDALFHLAFVNSRLHRAAFAHELEVIGTLNVMAAAQATGLPRLIIPSLTALYGARPQGPALCQESHPLAAQGVRFVTDRIEVERQLERFAERNPNTQVIVLRFAPIVGPSADNPFTRLLRTGLVPTFLGFDPLWQVVHQDDAVTALHLSLTTKAKGAFNIVGHAVAPFSTVVRLSGAKSVPMPGPLLRATIRAFEAAGLPSVPVPMLPFLRYSWVADDLRARRHLGFEARVPFREALASIRQRSA